MGLTGFNAGQVNNSLGRIQAAYNALVIAMSTGSGQQVVNKMADQWVCQDAIEFFTGYKNGCDKLIEQVDAIFQEVFRVMNEAAIAWAEGTGNAGVYSARNLVLNGERMSIDAIQENINGERGINIETAGTTFNTAMGEFLNTVTQATTAAQNAVEQCGFLGGSQAANLSGAIAEVKSRITMAANQANEAFVQVMGTTITNYGTLEANVSSAFTVSN